MGVGRGLDAKVAKHGVGFPAAQELDSVLLDVGAEEGGGAAGPEGATGHIGGVDACDRLQETSRVPEGVGDEGRWDVVPFVVGGVVVTIDRSFACSACKDKSADDASEGFDGTECGVVVGTMSDALTFYCVLLVSEFEVPLRSARDGSHVI